MNLFTALRDGFPKDWDSVAIEVVDAPGSSKSLYSWRDLDLISARFANFFNSLDIPVGARIVVHCDKSVESLLLYLAVLRGGWIYVPLNNAYRSSEVSHFFENAAPSVVVCASQNFEWIDELAQSSGQCHVFTLNDDQTGSLMSRSASLSVHHEPVTKLPDALAAILYTSGTTGRSKGAMLSHHNLLSNARTLLEYWCWNQSAAPKDVLIHALPIFHVHGLFVATHCALLSGSKMLWLNKFEPSRVVELLPQATVFMGVPTLYSRLMTQAELNAGACSNMRLFISGSAPLLVDTFEGFRKCTGHTILERYGMSETLMLTSNPCRTVDGPRMAGTVGQSLPGVDIRVHNDQGMPCKVDETGHVQVRGPNVCSGYWRMPEKTTEDFTPDGWFRTGDVGRLDSNGVLTLAGRSKDLVITGGLNVYPAEVECELNNLPGVDESAVIGLPHPDFGEAVAAVVVVKSGHQLDKENIIGTLKSRLASFKVPKEVIFAEDLPRNAMGKVQKNLLRAAHQHCFARPS